MDADRIEARVHRLTPIINGLTGKANRMRNGWLTADRFWLVNGTTPGTAAWLRQPSRAASG